GCGANAAKARAPLPRGITLGIGDIVSVTIFEPPGGLFVPSDARARPGNFVTLPNQIVDSNGNITVPYAGTIPAAGRTPSEVQQAINEALRALPRYRSGNRCLSPSARRAPQRCQGDHHPVTVREMRRTARGASGMPNQ